MAEDFSERRLAENEVLFRQKNEQVTEGLNALKESATSEGHQALVQNIGEPLHFYCECSDEKCHERIVLKPSEYQKLHQNRSQFIVLPGHVAPDYERVVMNAESYVVVEKFRTPPSSTKGKLNPTDLDHT